MLLCVLVLEGSNLVKLKTHPMAALHFASHFWALSCLASKQAEMRTALCGAALLCRASLCYAVRPTWCALLCFAITWASQVEQLCFTEILCLTTCIHASS